MKLGICLSSVRDHAPQAKSLPVKDGQHAGLVQGSFVSTSDP
jgi:hypothetical protein